MNCDGRLLVADGKALRGFSGPFINIYGFCKEAPLNKQPHVGTDIESRTAGHYESIRREETTMQSWMYTAFQSLQLPAV